MGMSFNFKGVKILYRILQVISLIKERECITNTLTNQVKLCK